jgi:hypothetical protein
MKKVDGTQTSNTNRPGIFLHILSCEQSVNNWLEAAGRDVIDVPHT